MRIDRLSEMKPIRVGCKEFRPPTRCLIVMILAVLLSACGSHGGVNEPTGAAPDSTSGTEHLTAAEVETIIAQAATQAQAVGLPVTIAVLDHEGTRLGILQMAGARTTTTIQGGGSGGLEGATLAGSAQFAAISKAGTAAFFGTQGNAFSTRSASFIVQEHFPPQVNPSAGGPLFGVQFSSLDAVMSVGQAIRPVRQTCHWVFLLTPEGSRCTKTASLLVELAWREMACIRWIKIRLVRARLLKR